MNPSLPGLRDAAEGLRQVRDDIRDAYAHAGPALSIVIERELALVTEQAIRLKRLADAVAEETSPNN